MISESSLPKPLSVRYRSLCRFATEASVGSLPKPVSVHYRSLCRFVTEACVGSLPKPVSVRYRSLCRFIKEACICSSQKQASIHHKDLLHYITVNSCSNIVWRGVINNLFVFENCVVIFKRYVPSAKSDGISNIRLPGLFTTIYSSANLYSVPLSTFSR
jgi:hypothetical protein